MIAGRTTLKPVASITTIRQRNSRDCTPVIRNGADNAALALHALAEVMEKARVARLTRFQHILLHLGELIAYAESAGGTASEGRTKK